MACWRRPMTPLKLSFLSHYYRLNQPDPISTSAAWFFKFVGVFALFSPLGWNRLQATVHYSRNGTPDVTESIALPRSDH